MKEDTLKQLFISMLLVAMATTTLADPNKVSTSSVPETYRVVACPPEHAVSLKDCAARVCREFTRPDDTTYVVPGEIVTAESMRQNAAELLRLLVDLQNQTAESRRLLAEFRAKYPSIHP
jgi:hypothetical protein